MSTRALTPEELARVERYRAEIERAHANVDHFEGLAPGSICPICRRKSRRRLAWDHDHKTNRFRGYICGKCNMATTKQSPTIRLDLSESEYSLLKSRLALDKVTVTEFFSAHAKRYLKRPAKEISIAGVAENNNIAD